MPSVSDFGFQFISELRLTLGSLVTQRNAVSPALLKKGFALLNQVAFLLVFPLFSTDLFVLFL